MQQVVYIIYPYSNLPLSKRKMNLDSIRACVNHYRNTFYRFDAIHRYISGAIANRSRISMKIYALI